MEYLVGILLGFVVAAVGTFFGLDRERSFYSTVLIVVASYYALFATMGASTGTLGVECAVGIGFLVLALVGFKKSMWLVAAGIIGHGVFDSVHHLFIENSGMPVWWPGFCGTIDIVMGGYLAARLFDVPHLLANTRHPFHPAERGEGVSGAMPDRLLMPTLGVHQQKACDVTERSHHIV